jgi:hypothetical protein
MFQVKAMTMKSEIIRRNILPSSGLKIKLRKQPAGSKQNAEWMQLVPLKRRQMSSTVSGIRLRRRYGDKSTRHLSICKYKYVCM